MASMSSTASSVGGQLAGRTCLVSGAGQGLGAAIATAFANEGGRVAVCDIDRGKADRVTASLGAQATAYRLDVRDAVEWSSTVAAVEAWAGPIGVLVNNAGIDAEGLIEDGDVAQWRNVVDTNLTSVFIGMSACVASLRRAGGGAIINMSSVAGLVGFPTRAAYVACKWGVRGLTKTAALELGRYGIRVNSLHPGPIRTPMTEHYPPETFRDQAIDRFGEAEEVARMAVFIAAQATYSTASEFIVDGGVMAGRAMHD